MMNPEIAHRQVGLILSACMASVVLPLGTLSAASVESKHPNLIVFITDQQRRDSVGCYGEKLKRHMAKAGEQMPRILPATE